ncbi:hypothetical protein NEOKW01_1931 [Nematocida sp. AWRm80]|nr:hypothetical protein NEOKW01_1931 [Nematocida sp. AWRm80]
MNGKHVHAIKSLMIYSGIFEMYYRLANKPLITTLLSRTEVFNRFNILEIANAKIYARRILDKHLVFGDIIEVFMACCIISKKYLNDFSKKNKDEIGSVICLSRVNKLEKCILNALNYNIATKLSQIQKEIETEKNIEPMYKKALFNRVKSIQTRVARSHLRQYQDCPEY